MSGNAPLELCGMDRDDRERSVTDLVGAADRLESLADTADLMGDDDAAIRFGRAASVLRLRAMALLDER